MRPRDLEALALPKVLEALAALAVSATGAEACRALRPAAERAAVERALDAQWSFHRLIETTGPVPLGPFPDVRAALALAAHEGAMLAGEQLVEIRTVLRQARLVQRHLRRHGGPFPALAGLPDRLHPLVELETSLGRMLDDAGILRDGASPRLAELRSSLRELRLDIEARLERMVGDHGDDGYVTVRNNRFVVPVKASGAFRVEGVVQDRSASGETLFVEPLFAIDLNNQLLLMRKEEEQEELRLLTLLTAQVGTVRPDIGSTLAALTEIDRLGAGAAFARRHGCTRPIVSVDTVALRAARHPELLLSGRAVVAVDVCLTAGARALVVSGPNTGGKTVALKTLGLLTALAHAGLLIPAAEGSELPFVRGVFTDLADDQSIERSLSTFSSHVANLVEIFEAADAPALVLLDEPGGGTDPEEGAALAVALIDRLIARGCLVAAATHYAPVKLWALSEPRVDLAAVDVDPRTFEPRYRLVHGSVGQSLGLAMAERLALPGDVLADAGARRERSARELATAIELLEVSRRRFEDERRALEEERHALAELERERAALVADLRERRRSRWQTDLAEGTRFVRDLKAEGRALLRAAREQGAAGARELRSFVQRAEQALAERGRAIEDPVRPDDAPPTVGDHVEVQGTSIRGELVALEGELARIRRGTITFEAERARVRRRDGAAAPATSWAVRAAGSSDDGTEPPVELHLVGLRVRDALRRLETFLDRALQSGAPSVRIVHGLGSGALKRAVGEYLAASSYCTGFRDAESADGGAGVTIVELG